MVVRSLLHAMGKPLKIQAVTRSTCRATPVPGPAPAGRNKLRTTMKSREEEGPLERPIAVCARGGPPPEPRPGVIEACRRGEREAFRALFEAYKDCVYSIARNFTGSEAAAHDVTQEVFLKLFAAIRGYRGESGFRTWLFRLVVNACLDERRRLRRLVPIQDAPVPVETQAGSAETGIARRELGRQVRSALSALSPKLRLAILLRHVEELSYEQIAEVTGCSPGTVASRLNRGHRALARRLSHLRGSV
jgi:RNA polymerase sigma-70 factor (ECF subfamily)